MIGNMHNADTIEDPSPTTTFETTDHFLASLRGIRATHCMPHAPHTLSIRANTLYVQSWSSLLNVNTCALVAPTIPYRILRRNLCNKKYNFKSCESFPVSSWAALSAGLRCGRREASSRFRLMRSSSAEQFNRFRPIASSPSESSVRLPSKRTQRNHFFVKLK